MSEPEAFVRRPNEDGLLGKSNSQTTTTLNAYPDKVTRHVTTDTGFSLGETDDWPICTACGTQFPPARQSRTTCFICDDPRQFTPPSGQSFTNLSTLASHSSENPYKNVFTQYQHDDRITFIYTVPKFGIGQRCVLIKTPVGNLLWDCITFLDMATIRQVNELGGIKAIVISHPHYYSTNILWARAFNCKVYLAAEDSQWLAQKDPDRQVFIPEGETETNILADSGVKALKLGGHFPGSLVLLFDGRLMVADTLLTTPAGLGTWIKDAVGNQRQGHLGRPEGMNSFAFMWSIPNMIPLSPEEMAHMWAVLGSHEFKSTHGAFMGTDIEDERIKERVLESMKIQIRRMGWTGHPFLALRC